MAVTPKPDDVTRRKQPGRVTVIEVDKPFHRQVSRETLVAWVDAHKPRGERQKGVITEIAEALGYNNPQSVSMVLYGARHNAAISAEIDRRLRAWPESRVLGYTPTQSAPTGT